MINIKCLLLAGVGLIAIGFQNSAKPSSIETLVMPGPVSQAHADIETECDDCHAAFSKSLQRDQCLSCHEHENVLQDQQASTGFHGLFEPARNVECSSCHNEHEGRDADIVGFEKELFDHAFTDFILEGAHVELVCEACHLADQQFRQAPGLCKDCHEEDDSHQGHLGESCGNCHRETSWEVTSFDHSKNSDYELTGAHTAVECALCHVNQRYEGTPTECFSCHQIDDKHQGEYGEDCQQCHLTQQWKESSFDHAQASDFPLLGQHQEVNCNGCHQGNLFDGLTSAECASCHLVDDIHQGSYGIQCGDCHDSKEWSNTSFNHKVDTDFALLGAHQNLSCKICHASGASGISLETACIGCHLLDDVHETALGENCGHCHDETAWAGKLLFDHDLSTFPLIGLHSTVPCEACHISRQYAGISGQCIDCHEQNDPHQGHLGSNCGSCHNPNDWQLWEFDHNQSTEFVLDGAHSDLECQSCHQTGDQYLSNPASNCADCHRSDDIHAGQFGRQCSRCHDSDSFSVDRTENSQ